MFVFFLFSLRLFQVQIVDGKEYADLAGRNTTTELTIAASRGEILDRNLNPIAVNRASYSVVFDYAFSRGERMPNSNTSRTRLFSP